MSNDLVVIKEVAVNDVPVNESPPTNEDLGDKTVSMIRLRITHTLTIFPKISHSMLQLGIGTGFPPAIWDPVLDQLMAEGVVKKTSVSATHPVTGRDQTYSLISLVETE